MIPPSSLKWEQAICYGKPNIYKKKKKNAFSKFADSFQGSWSKIIERHLISRESKIQKHFTRCNRSVSMIEAAVVLSRCLCKTIWESKEEIFTVPMIWNIGYNIRGNLSAKPFTILRLSNPFVSPPWCMPITKVWLDWNHFLYGLWGRYQYDLMILTNNLEAQCFTVLRVPIKPINFRAPKLKVTVTSIHDFEWHQELPH